MDLDQKWRWASRKLPRRLIPLGELSGDDDGTRSAFRDQLLSISQTQSDKSPAESGEGEAAAAATEAASASLASRRGGTGGTQARKKKFSTPAPKSPPRRVILNLKLERVQAALKNRSALVDPDSGKATGGGGRGGGCGGGDEDEEDSRSKKGALLAALLEAEGSKKQRQATASKRPSLSSPSTNARRPPGIMSLTSGSTRRGDAAGSDKEGTIASGQAQKTTPRPHPNRGSTYGATAAFDLNNGSTGAMATTGGGGGSGVARGPKAVTAAGAVEQGGLQLKPPTPIDHRRKSRLPDYFEEGDEKSLGFNLRNLHLFPLPRTIPEAGGGGGGGGREGGATMTPRGVV